VRYLATKFGESAGKIWQVLNEKGCLKKDEILETTKLNETDFHIGIGWLARENKISREDEDCFKLDATNLETEIGTHAGKVWKILDIWGDANLTTIKRLSGLDEEEVYRVLGWLAREDKIHFNEKQKFILK
jgi:hypothetical protein